MNYCSLATLLCEYYSINRGVGHSEAIWKHLPSEALYLTGSRPHANSLIQKGVKAITPANILGGRLIGCRNPLVIDHVVVQDICYELLKVERERLRSVTANEEYSSRISELSTELDKANHRITMLTLQLQRLQESYESFKSSPS